MPRQRTVRVLAVALSLIFLSVPALASPEARTGGAVVHLSLRSRLVAKEPFDRWLEELCQLARVEADVLSANGVRMASYSLYMGASHALTLEIIERDGCLSALDSALGQGGFLRGDTLWAEELIDLSEKILALPSSGLLLAYSGESLSDAMRFLSLRARSMKLFADAAGEANCENAAKCLNGLAELFETAGKELLLEIRVESYAPKDAAPPRPFESRRALPGGYAAELIGRAAAETLRAICESE